MSDSQKILHNYLEDVLKTVVQPVNVFTASAKGAGETRLYFGALRVKLIACLNERGGVCDNGSWDLSVDNPGIRVTIRNILYGENQRRVTRYFPVNDPDCSKKVLALIESARTCNVAWDD